MKKYITLGAVAMSLLTTGCSNDLISENSPVDNSGKERIVLGAGDGQSVFQTRAGFSEQTRIVARYVSENRAGTETKCVKTVLSAAKEASGAGYSVVSYNEGKTRYWDDAHGRNSRLSVFAVAIPNVNDASDNSNLKESVLAGGDTWSTTDATKNIIEWTVNYAPEYADLAAEDLTYSNNIQEVGDKGVYTWDYSSEAYPTPTWSAETKSMNASRHTYTEEEVTKYDGRMYFTQKDKSIKDDVTDAPGHFDKGQMEFKHALTRIQVNLIKGDGYGTSSTFAVSGMQVLGQNLTGTFDIESGAWKVSSNQKPITMAKWGTAASRTDGRTNAATYEAQMIPGYLLDNNSTNVLQLTVDGNTYYITNAQLRTALTGKLPEGDDYRTKMGTRYIFDITVAKAKIQDITATIVDWNEVEAEVETIDNSHLTFSFYNNGTPCTDIKLFKYEQSLGQIYTDNTYAAPAVAGSEYAVVAGLSRVGETNTFTTSEYYNDNKTAYHFRTTNADTNLDDGNKTFTMTSGAASTANDYHWGAPMKTGLSSGKLPYDLSNGYLSSIEKGIVAASTESTINLTEVHMMSQVVVKLTSIPSSAQTAAAKVNLAGATVKLTKLSKTGTVDMGSGLITPATGDGIGDLTAVTVAKEGETDVYSCTLNVIPQALTRGTTDNDYVGITIHTADNNEYYIVKKLSEIIATSVGSEITNMQEAGEGKYITRWYPGHKYIYTFNITKTEIKNITATIVNWNEVVAGNTDLDLEK